MTPTEFPAVSNLSTSLPSRQPAAPLPEDERLHVAARALVPLLKPVRRQVGGQVSVGPGNLPPSPFTGRSSTVAAVTIGIEPVQVDERVIAAMDRLLAWKTSTPLPDEERTLMAAWLDALQRKVVGRMIVTSRGVDCDAPCAVQRLTKPDALFGASRREQRETRDRVLLEAMIDAVNTVDKQEKPR